MNKLNPVATTCAALFVFGCSVTVNAAPSGYSTLPVKIDIDGINHSASRIKLRTLQGKTEIVPLVGHIDVSSGPCDQLTARIDNETRDGDCVAIEIKELTPQYGPSGTDYFVRYRYCENSFPPHIDHTHIYRMSCATTVHRRTYYLSSKDDTDPYGPQSLAATLIFEFDLTYSPPPNTLSRVMLYNMAVRD